MHTREKLERELNASGDTAFAFFTKAYLDVYHHACRSNQVVIDAQRYNSTRAIPPYVFRYFEKLDEANRALPVRAARLHSMLGLDRAPFQMVDVSPVLYARKGRDGVWRTSS